MQEITTIKELRIAIEAQERLKEKDLILLQHEIHSAMSGLNPSNLIDKAFTGSNLRSFFFNAAIGYTTGVVVKKIVIDNSGNPVTKFIGNVIKFFVANKLVKDVDQIKKVGGRIIDKLMKKSDCNETP